MVPGQLAGRQVQIVLVGDRRPAGLVMKAVGGQFVFHVVEAGTKALNLGDKCLDGPAPRIHIVRVTDTHMPKNCAPSSAARLGRDLPRRNTDHRRALGNILGHHGIAADFRAHADNNVTQNLGAGADNNIVFQSRVTLMQRCASESTDGRTPPRVTP